MENTEIAGRIQRERFVPKKSNSFRGITFFSFLPKRPKFSVPLVGLPVPGFMSRESENFFFYNGTTQSRSCFQCL